MRLKFRSSTICPLHIPSVNPNVSTRLCHLAPPLSFLRRYAINFCRRCTRSRRLRLFILSIVPRVSRNWLNVRIFAVNSAICTSLLPVSGPARGVLGRSDAWEMADAGRGGSCVSVSCRPKSEMMRWVLIRRRSLEFARLRLEMRRSASSAVSCCSSRSGSGTVLLRVSSKTWLASGTAASDTERVER